jgi:hypothetical protein
MTIVPPQPPAGPPKAPAPSHVAHPHPTPLPALVLPKGWGESSDVLPEPARPAYVPDATPEPGGPPPEPTASARRGKGRRSRRR